MQAGVTVIVLTHNRRDEVLLTVARLLALPEHPTVIVADNASSDGTADALALRFPAVRVVRCPANLGAAGRNAAAALVRSGYLAFSDDDTDWQPGSLARAAALLDATPRAAVLCAEVRVGPQRVLDPTCARMAASPLHAADLPGPALIGHMAGACVMRAEVFHALGGYEPRLFIGGEETLLALDLLAAGHAIVYCAALQVHHRPSLARDSALRERLLARNAALVAWLRLPAAEAWRHTWRAATRALRTPHAWDELRALARGIAWAWPRRHAAPPTVLAMRARVHAAEHAQALRQAAAPQAETPLPMQAESGEPRIKATVSDS